jgi:predicted sulfurtransferase
VSVALLGTLVLSSKFRVSEEGYNITAAGERLVIDQLMDLFLAEYIPHADLLVSHLQEFRNLFFKPAKGCEHCFDGLSVKVVNELCPLDGVKRKRTVTSSRIIKKFLDERGIKNNIVVEELTNVTSLDPADFHQHLLNLGERGETETAEDDSNKPLLIDLRNYYESRIGHFREAVLPPLRRFSSLPAWLDSQIQGSSESCVTAEGADGQSIPTKSHFNKVDKETEQSTSSEAKRNIYTYCTGGIRCDQASEYLQKSTGANVTTS